MYMILIGQISDTSSDKRLYNFKKYSSFFEIIWKELLEPNGKFKQNNDGNLLTALICHFHKKMIKFDKV